MKIEFDYNGTFITDPYYDETGRFPVNPETYYGDEYKRAFILEYVKDTHTEKDFEDFRNFDNQKIYVIYNEIIEMHKPF